MNIFAFLLFAVGAFARPDVSELGYQYRNPVNSYEAPTGSIGDLNQRQYYHVDERTFHSPTANLETPIHEHTAFTNTQTFKTFESQPTSQLPVSPIALGTQTSGRLPVSPFPTFSGTSNLNVDQGAKISSLNAGGNSGLNVNGGFSTLTQRHGEDASFTSGINSGTIGQFGTSQGGFNVHSNLEQTELSKHLYFYTAPEEHEIIRPRINYLSGPGKKNVKIIFIKAPSSTIGGPITIPALPQNEEKTVVYVLVKKQDEQALINVEASQASKPTKPEVFFIKYKTQKEAEDAVSKVQNGIIPQGVLQNANSLEGDHEFISNIGQDINHVDARGNFDLKYHSGENSASVSSGESSEEVGHGSINYNSGLRGSAGISGTTTGTNFVVGQAGSGSTSTISRQPYTGFTGYQEASSVAPDFSGSVHVSSTIAPSVAPALHSVYGPPH